MLKTVMSLMSRPKSIYIFITVVFIVNIIRLLKQKVLCDMVPQFHKYVLYVFRRKILFKKNIFLYFNNFLSTINDLAEKVMKILKYKEF